MLKSSRIWKNFEGSYCMVCLDPNCSLFWGLTLGNPAKLPNHWEPFLFFLLFLIRRWTFPDGYGGPNCSWGRNQVHSIQGRFLSSRWVNWVVSIRLGKVKSEALACGSKLLSSTNFFQLFESLRSYMIQNYCLKITQVSISPFPTSFSFLFSGISQILSFLPWMITLSYLSFQ